MAPEIRRFLQALIHAGGSATRILNGSSREQDKARQYCRRHKLAFFGGKPAA